MKKRKFYLTAVAVVCLLGICLGLAFTALAGDLSSKYPSLLVLGDSISTGYGLTGASTSDPYSCASYGNRLAADLKLVAGKTYINRAVNGDASADLLKLLPSLKSQVESSKLIVISIGGNDFLGKLPQIMTLITGKTYTTLQSCIGAVSTMQASDAKAALSNPQVLAYFQDILTQYSTNLAKIMTLLYQYNPNARVLFLEQYNPASGVAAFAGLDSMSTICLGQLNSIMRTCAAQFNFETVDVPSVIDVAAMARTNILTYDIHPNAAGHGEIYALLLQTLMYDKPAVETTSPETTQKPVETTKPVEITAVPETTIPAVTTAKPIETTSPVTTAKPVVTTAPVVTTSKPVETTAPVVTTAEITSAVEATEGTSSAPETEAETTAPDAEKKGCKSAVIGGVAVIAVLGSALVLRRKES